jgi:hypothetical protein
VNVIGRSSGDPSLTAATSTVPASVPSLRHTECPPAASCAVNRSVPLKFTRWLGFELAVSGRMSFTRDALSLPTVTPHSSSPSASEAAEKKSVSPTGVSDETLRTPAGVTNDGAAPRGPILRNPTGSDRT